MAGEFIGNVLSVEVQKRDQGVYFGLRPCL